MALHLDRFLPIPDAAARLRMSEVKLRAWIDKGKIRAAILPGGEIGVSEQAVIVMTPSDKESLPEYQKHIHLRGTQIGINEAAKRYRIPYTTMYQWVQRGIIHILGREGQKVLLDECDVAYCAEIYYQRGGQGKWLFNQDGTPYKHGTSSLGKISNDV